MVEFYQRPDLDGVSSVSLWDFNGSAQYFGLSQEKRDVLEARHRQSSDVTGQLLKRIKRERVDVMVGERAGQMVGEAQVFGAVEHEGKEIRCGMRYLLSKTDDGHWRFINFSSY